MASSERRFFPGQMQISHLKRGSAVVAIDGSLRIRYRDESLNWLADSVPRASHLLEAGDRHVLPHDAYVAFHVPGGAAVTGLILPTAPSRPWAFVVRFLGK